MNCEVCSRPAVMMHGTSPRCGYHKPSFSERTRKGEFQDFGAPEKEQQLEHQRENYRKNYGPRSVPLAPAPRPASASARKATFKVVAISLYPEDVALLARLVEQARAAGARRANKSSIIRHALTLVDVNNLPKVMP